MIPASEDFEGTWAFAPLYCESAGFKQHYIDEGAGRPGVLLHGQPTWGYIWGYIWRCFVGPLAKTHRAIVPDHMGFGKSETPADRVYTLRTHVENLTAPIDSLDLRDITLVMQDWGDPIGIGYAVRHPDRIHSLVLMNTVFGYGAAGHRDLPDQHDHAWDRVGIATWVRRLRG